MLRGLLAAGLFTLAAWPAAACGPALEVTYRESAPKDIFVIRNVGESFWRLQALSIDLGPSAGALIYDTVSGGAGIDVAQPFEQLEPLPGQPGPRLLETPAPLDGATELTLRFEDFGGGQRFAFTIDLDDRLQPAEAGRTRVSDAEIFGTVVRAVFSGGENLTVTQEGRFDINSVALLRESGCV